MSYLLGVLLVGAAWLLLRRLRPSLATPGAVGLGALLWAPVPSLIGAAGLAALGLRRRLARRRSQEAAADEDVTLLSELTLLGLSAGLTFPNSLALAARHVAAPLEREVQTVLRRSSHAGPTVALETTRGRGAGLYRLAARAAVTGAPIAGAVQAFVDDRRADERAAELAAARRLPVRLLFPLALLILPGFMVLTVGPAVLSTVERISF